MGGVGGGRITCFGFASLHTKSQLFTISRSSLKVCEGLGCGWGGEGV